MVLLTFSLSSCERDDKCYGFCGYEKEIISLNSFIAKDGYYVIYDANFDGNYIVANGNFKLDKYAHFKERNIQRGYSDDTIQKPIDFEKTCEVNNLVFNADGTLDYQGKLLLYFNVGENFFDDADIRTEFFFNLTTEIYIHLTNFTFYRN